MTAETIVGVLCLLAGLLVIAAHYAPTPAPALLTPAAATAQRAHALGLGHRLAARAIRSSYRPADGELAAVAALYQLSPLRLSDAHVELVSPLLEVEQLMERLDRITARARSWSLRGRRV